jgi:prepilin-type N-terminal cleavage/methylation domain-containing protein
MKSDNKGFTLIELIIAVTIILIVSLGFFGWASTIIQTNLSIERNNTAYTMAMDVAERLQRMSDNSLIQPSTAKYVGYNSSGELRKCSAGAITTNPVTSDVTGKTEYTDPTRSSTTPYLFDNNECNGLTWVTTACRTGSTIATASNTNIDHPNSTTGTPNYDSINPIRSYKNTTYYAVWSIAYLPCNAGTNTDRRKIFVTVYWIDPEPGTTISSGATVKSVSIVVDKVIGTES